MQILISSTCRYVIWSRMSLHASQSQMAILFGIGALAWYVKPLAGLLVDNVALFGTHRRHYLIFSTLIAAALWLLLGIVSHSYWLLLVTIVAMQCMLVIGSTVLGGFLVERGKLLEPKDDWSPAAYSLRMRALSLPGRLRDISRGFRLPWRP